MKSKVDGGTPPALITFGVGGHMVYYESSAFCGAMTRRTCSGYASPESFFALRPSHRPDGPIARDHDPMEFQGVPVIDMRDAVCTKEGRHMAISGPMVNPGLKDNEVETCPPPSPMLARGLADSFAGALVQVQEEQRRVGVRAGTLDSVSVPEYIRMWRYAGARIGAVRGLGIEFEHKAKAPEIAMPKEDQDELLLDGPGALRAPVVEEPEKAPASQAPSVEARYIGVTE